MGTALTANERATNLQPPDRLAGLLIAELRHHANRAAADRARTVMPGVRDVMGTPMTAVTALANSLAKTGKDHPDEVMPDR